MPDLFGRLRAAIIMLAAASLAAAMLAPAASAAAREPMGLDAFMRAMGQVESSGRYDAINAVSGAYGKYQIMPANWPVWAKLHLGDAKAPQTPENQEKVARGRFIALYRWLGSWPRVAHWWLTGSTRPMDQWSAKGRWYVDKVMTLSVGKGWTLATAAAGPAPGAAGAKPTTTKPTTTKAVTKPAPPPPPMRLDQGDPAIVWSGSWAGAAYAGYAGGSVAWSTSRGSWAELTFSGRMFSWIGPVGPTRGTAQVYVDGRLVQTVSEYAPNFGAQRTLFTRTFGASAQHTVRIVVLGTEGHPMVAIDQLAVGF